MDIICIGHIIRYLDHNVHHILHIYSSSVNDWCNVAFKPSTTSRSWNGDPTLLSFIILHACSNITVNIVQWNIYIARHNHQYYPKCYLYQKKSCVFQWFNNALNVCRCSGIILFDFIRKKRLKKIMR